MYLYENTVVDTFFCQIWTCTWTNDKYLTTNIQALVHILYWLQFACLAEIRNLYNLASWAKDPSVALIPSSFVDFFSPKKLFKLN